MKTVLTAALLLTASMAVAEPCFGPGGCQSTPELTGPAELCLPDGCQPIQYSWTGDIVVAESQLVNGYSILGWAGPCVHEDHAQCPNIFEQAFQDLQINALRTNRAQSF